MQKIIICLWEWTFLRVVHVCQQTYLILWWSAIWSIKVNVFADAKKLFKTTSFSLSGIHYILTHCSFESYLMINGSSCYSTFLSSVDYRVAHILRDLWTFLFLVGPIITYKTSHGNIVILKEGVVYSRCILVGFSLVTERDICLVWARQFVLLCINAGSGNILADIQAIQISRSHKAARPNGCLILSRYIIAALIRFWPDSGWILALSGRKFSYGLLSDIAMG